MRPARASPRRARRRRRRRAHRARARPRPRATRSPPGARRGPRGGSRRTPTATEQPNDGRSSASSATSVTRHVDASGRRLDRDAEDASRQCGPRARAWRGRRRRGPRAPSAVSASSSSPFTRATPSGPPRSPACASPTLVITPTVGRARSRTARRCRPATRAPISSTSASVSPARPSSVSGRPISLLNDPGLACTRNVRRERGRR